MRKWLFAALAVVFVAQLCLADDDEDDEGGSDQPAAKDRDECEWTVPGTSRTYDLTGMVRAGKDEKDDWKAEEDIQGFKFDYYFNVCGNSIKGCNGHDTSASQYQIFGGTSAGCIPLAENWKDNGHKNMKWSEFGNPGSDSSSGGVAIKYINGQVCSTGGEKFSLTLKIPCGTTKRQAGVFNDGLDPKKFVVEQDSASGCEYTITFPAIEDGCPGSGHGSNWGWYFIFFFLMTLALYFGVGIFFRMKKLGYTGRDAIPHIEFWESLPGLVVDGIKFTIEQCRYAIERIQESRRK